MRNEKLAMCGVWDWKTFSLEFFHISTGFHIVEKKMANNEKFIISMWTSSCCLAYCIKSSFVVLLFPSKHWNFFASSEILLMIFSTKKDLWFNQIYEGFQRKLSHRVSEGGEKNNKNILKEIMKTLGGREVEYWKRKAQFPLKAPLLWVN